MLKAILILALMFSFAISSVAMAVPAPTWDCGTTVGDPVQATFSPSEGLSILDYGISSFLLAKSSPLYRFADANGLIRVQSDWVGWSGKDSHGITWLRTYPTSSGFFNSNEEELYQFTAYTLPTGGLSVETFSETTETFHPWVTGEGGTVTYQLHPRVTYAQWIFNTCNIH